jgi:glycosyltransferase involved in cell wall biosynthesis
MQAEQLHEMLRLATTLDPVCASEYQLLLQQATAKALGRCDDAKVRYCTQVQPAGQPMTGATYLSWVLAQCRAAGVQQPLVVLWPACYASPALVQALQPSQVVVDLVDDQRLFPGNAAQRRTITEQYQRFIHLADRVVSNAPGLIQAFAPEFGRPIEHLPNAVLPLLPLPTQPANGPHSQQAPVLPPDDGAPVVGYVGNLRDRIDVDTLLSVITRHPEWRFWFVGQAHRSAFYKAAKPLPNVRFWGTWPHAQAQTILQRFHVAIVPFEASPLVASMSPIKQDDYRRGQRPTVRLDPNNKSEFERALQAVLHN